MVDLAAQGNKKAKIIVHEPISYEEYFSPQHQQMEKKFQKHKELIDDLHELYVTKNSDYGDSVHDTYKKYGLTSFLVRLEDKLNRARTLSRKGTWDRKVLDEKIEDTLLDMANYAILAVIELQMDQEAKKHE